MAGTQGRVVRMGVGAGGRRIQGPQIGHSINPILSPGCVTIVERWDQPARSSSGRATPDGVIGSVVVGSEVYAARDDRTLVVRRGLWFGRNGTRHSNASPPSVSAASPPRSPRPNGAGSCSGSRYSWVPACCCITTCGSNHPPGSAPNSPPEGSPQLWPCPTARWHGPPASPLPLPRLALPRRNMRPGGCPRSRPTCRVRPGWQPARCVPSKTCPTPAESL